MIPKPTPRGAGMMKSSIPEALRLKVFTRDSWQCIGPRIEMPGVCHWLLEIDHVRASGGLGMKSATELSNLVTMCSTHHREKTERGRVWRPKQLEYLAASRNDESVLGFLR